MTLKAEREARIAAKAAAKAEKIAAEEARIKANPIYAAIAPQRAAAMAHAALRVEAQLRKVAEQLQGSDLNLSAPDGNSLRDSRRMYLEKRAYRGLARQVCLIERRSCRSPGDPEQVIGINEEGIARLVQQAADATALSFDGYVAKLTAKVGMCDAASVEGNLWYRSVLTVAKGDRQERWFTQQIVNVSVLGNLFNQWPTRLAK